MLDIDYLKRAYKYALGSPDPRTQNGAVIVNHGGYSSHGCNEFPFGVVSKPERLEHPLKYNFIEHAERNSIYDAAFSGMSTYRATMYCPWFACADCARAIICAGISKVVGHQQMFDATPEHWKESIGYAMEMLDEAGVEMTMVDAYLGVAPIRFNGELWHP